VDSIPVKRKGKKQRDRYFNYLYLRNEDGIVLEQRREKDIWQKLYQLPLIESDRPIGAAELGGRFLPSPPFLDQQAPSSLELRAEDRHTLSHQRIHARFWSVPIPERNWPSDWFQVEEMELDRYAFPKPIERFLG
jgi:A/G-specific adenine glycosylase